MRKSKESRRGALKSGLAALGGLIATPLFTGSEKVSGAVTPIKFQKFAQNMPVPPVKQPVSIGTPPWEVGDCFHGVAPEYFDRSTAEDPSVEFPQLMPEIYYEMTIRASMAEILPGIKTPIMGYDGIYPGPTFRTRSCQPMVVRQYNQLADSELSTHLHGGHFCLVVQGARARSPSALAHVAGLSGLCMGAGFVGAGQRFRVKE